MPGVCDALFVSVEGGFSFEIFLLGRAGIEPEILGRHIVSSERLLQSLPRLQDMLAPRFLIRADSVQQLLQGQGLLQDGDCPCAAHVWSGLLDRLKAPTVPQEDIQDKIRALQRRFLRLALVGPDAARPDGPQTSTDSPLIAAEIGGLLDAFGLRLRYTGLKPPAAKGDREVEDLRRIGVNPGLGLTALSNGIKVISGLRQLLVARYPGSVADGGRQEELLRIAFRHRSCQAWDDAEQLQPWQADTNAFTTPAASTPSSAEAAFSSSLQARPPFAVEKEPYSRDSSWCPDVNGHTILHSDSFNSASAGRLSILPDTESVRADELDLRQGEWANCHGTGPVFPQSRLQPPSSWQSILTRAPRWSHGAGNHSTSPGQQSRSRRRDSEPPGRKSDGSMSTPRVGRRDAHFERMRARATRAIASKSPDPGITEAVKRAQHRAKKTQQQQAEKDAEDMRARTGPTGEVLPHATASLFKRRDQRLQRFVQRQEAKTPDLLRSSAALAAMESPQPVPLPEPCPLVIKDAQRAHQFH